MDSAKTDMEAPVAVRPSEKSRWPFSIEFTMVMTALLVRMALLAIPQNRIDDSSYSNEISNIAISLSQGQGFSAPFPGELKTGPSAWIPPIYPFLCSVIIRLAGSYGRTAIVSIMAMNGLFSAFTCVPLFRAASRIFNRRVGFIAGWSFALIPYFARWSVTWVWEITLSTLFMTTLLLLILNVRDNPSWRNWIILGVVWGLSMLNNPSSMTLVGIAFLCFLYWQGIKSWKYIATTVLLCVVIIFPWLVRNRVVMGKWIFIRSNFGFELDLGNYHGSRGDCWMGHHPWANHHEYELYAQLGESEYVARKGIEAKQFISQYPSEFLSLCWWRFKAFWSGAAMKMRPVWQWYWIPDLYPIFTVTTAFGLLLMLWRKMPETYLLFFTILLYPWPYYLDCVQTRFRHLIDPMMLMITVYVLVEIGTSIWRGYQIYSRREDTVTPPPSLPQAQA